MMRCSMEVGRHYPKPVGVLLLALGVIAAMAGCGPIPGPILPIPDPGPSVDLEIRTWHDLDAVRENLAGNHRLMNSLNATTPGYDELAGSTADDGRGWYPIGAWDPYDHNLYLAFTGKFDGQGYEIADLFIGRPDRSDVGLFGYVAGQGAIKSVGVTNITVTGSSWVGGLVGGNAGTVTKSYSSGIVTGDGGLVGANMGDVTYCYSTASVIGSSRVGGLVGLNDRGTVMNSYAAGNVTGHHTDVGGLVGTNWGVVRKSYSSGRVIGELAVGGLVGGDMPVTRIVSNSFWDVETSGIGVSDGGTGKMTAEMMDIATYTDTETEGLDEAWDMVAVADADHRNPAYTWNIVDGQTYPFLSWQSG